MPGFIELGMRREEQKRKFAEEDAIRERMRQLFGDQMQPLTFPQPEGSTEPAYVSDQQVMQMNPMLKGMRDSGVPEYLVESARNNPDVGKSLLDIGMKSYLQNGKDEDRNWAVKLAMSAAGVDPSKKPNQLTKEEAQRVYSYYSPPTAIQYPGGTYLAPRGSALGAMPNPTPVPSPVLEDISKTSTHFENMKRLNSSFKDSFAGYKSDLLGDMSISYKKKFGDQSDADQVEWWQQYQDHVNAVRKDLFGSALTEPEKKEFEKAMVTPGMAGPMVRRNLNRQEMYARRAAAKVTRAASANTGYNQQQIREAAGQSADELLTGKEQSQSPTVIRWERDKNGNIVRARQ